ncbi:hypothetical protein DOY81_015141, partial [Sarcophaga bullata]
MEFLNSLTPLIIFLSVFMGICQMHPVVNSDGTYQSQPAVTQQTELDGDLVLHSQAEGSSSDSGLRISLFKAAEKT